MSIKEIELAMYEFVQGHNFSEPQKKAVIDFVFAQLEKFGASQAQQTTDAARVLEWMRTPNRKPANLAFTEGPERQAAYWIEIAQQEMQQTTAELPEPTATYIGECPDGSLVQLYDDTLKRTKFYTAAQMQAYYAAGVRAGGQDAKRYRWLREQQWQDNKLGVVLRPKDNTVLGCFIPSKELLDGAIDRYMSGKNDAMQGGQQ